MAYARSSSLQEVTIAVIGPILIVPKFYPLWSAASRPCIVAARFSRTSWPPPAYVAYYAYSMWYSHVSCRPPDVTQERPQRDDLLRLCGWATLVHLVSAQTVKHYRTETFRIGHNLQPIMIGVEGKISMAHSVSPCVNLACRAFVLN